VGWRRAACWDDRREPRNWSIGTFPTPGKTGKNGVIAARRVGHEIFYRITDTKAAALMIALQEGDLGDGENNISIPRHMMPNNVAPRRS
jgi:hypothetical protein